MKINFSQRFGNDFHQWPCLLNAFHVLFASRFAKRSSDQVDLGSSWTQRLANDLLDILPKTFTRDSLVERCLPVVAKCHCELQPAPRA